MTSTFVRMQSPPPLIAPPRYLHAAVIYNNCMYIFGGTNGPTFLNDIWKFDLIALSWLPLSTTSVPDARIGHAAVVVGDYMYIYGGLSSFNLLDPALYRLNLITMVWSAVTTSGASPLGRFSPSLNYDPINNRLVVFGGATTIWYPAGYVSYINMRSSSLLYLSLDTFVWTEVATATSDCPSANCPGLACNNDCKARLQHTAVLIDTLLVVFGGSSFIHYANDACQSSDLSVFNTTCYSWLVSSNITSSPPPPRQGHAMVARPDGTILLFGGYGGVVLNDVWSYKVPMSYCSYHGNQVACLSDAACAWDTSTRSCSLISSGKGVGNTSISSQACKVPVCSQRIAAVSSVNDRCFSCIGEGGCRYCENTPLGVYLCIPSNTSCPAATYSYSQCSTCSVYSNCRECTSGGCAWNTVANTCSTSSSVLMSNVAVRPSQCQAPCSVFTSCNTCPYYCFWCGALNSCVTATSMTTQFAFGQCLAYAPFYGCASNSCQKLTSCSSCLQSSYCGWCGQVDLVGSGTCYAGTFAGPGLYTPTSGTQCSATVVSNLTWAYGECQDVNQCLVPSLNTCGNNSTCADLPDFNPDTGSTMGYK
jgi:hypothetical protein